MEKKRAIRNYHKSIRDNMTLEDRACQNNYIQKQILEMLKDENIILMYAPINSEVDVYPVIEKAIERNIRVALPRVEGKNMDFYFIETLEDLSKGNFNVPEPKSYCKICIERQCKIIVPGLAFSTAGTRLGYGGGFYDRYFYRFPDLYKIGVCYDNQLDENLFAEEHDISMDLVLHG